MENTTYITAANVSVGDLIKINNHSFTKENGFIDARIIFPDKDRILICCLSTELSDDLKEKFGNHVLSFEFDRIEEVLCNILYKNLFKYGYVQYKEHIHQNPLIKRI